MALLGNDPTSNIERNKLVYSIKDLRNLVKNKFMRLYKDDQAIPSHIYFKIKIKYKCPDKGQQMAVTSNACNINQSVEGYQL